MRGTSSHARPSRFILTVGSIDSTRDCFVYHRRLNADDDSSVDESSSTQQINHGMEGNDQQLSIQMQSTKQKGNVNN
jgi:hypothetical protein